MAILYINGKKIDLTGASTIAFTAQVNNLNSVQGRNSSGTNIFRVFKTANNVEAMQYLSFTGNNSNIPYQKNPCRLFGDNGECIVYNGWAVVSDEGDSYEIQVVDGIIDLYKSTENLSLADVVGSDINHVKDVITVKDSWNGTTPYRYILADYNGDTGDTAAGIVNIDYLVPSVKVSYLWERIKEFCGFNATGAVFNTFNFQNLWLTFPKAYPTNDSSIEIFTCSSWGLTDYPDGSNKTYATIVDADTNELEAINSNIHMKVTETGYYKLVVSGHLQWFGGGAAGQRRIYLVSNADGQAPNVPPIFKIIKEDLPGSVDLENETIYFDLQAHQSIAVVIQGGYINAPYNLDVQLIKQQYSYIDFQDQFQDFSLKDFMSEIIYRFGLTMYKNKYSNDYEFLTLQEQLQTPDISDWSSKFNSKVSENYLYGQYAQKNWFRYNYNDKESTYHDAYLEVDNVNLEESKDVFKSRIYAPERFDGGHLYLNTPSNVYKFYDKEVSNDPENPINYKTLDKRYFLMRAQQVNGSITVVSAELDQAIEASMYYIESYYRLSFQNIKNDYYSPLIRVLDRAIIVKAELYLTDVDIANLDLKKLVYIEQLSNYYILNKVENYIPGKVTKCELVRVLYSTPQIIAPAVSIYKVVLENFNVSVYFSLTQSYPYLTLQFKTASESTWNSYPAFTSGTNPKSYLFSPVAGTYQIRLKAGDYYSNIVEFDLPDNAVIEI